MHRAFCCEVCKWQMQLVTLHTALVMATSILFTNTSITCHEVIHGSPSNKHGVKDEVSQAQLDAVRQLNLILLCGLLVLLGSSSLCGWWVLYRSSGGHHVPADA